MNEPLELKPTGHVPETEFVTLGDGENTLDLVIDPSTGEIIFYPVLPAEIVGDAKAIAVYVGPRLADMRAKLAGVVAERADILKRVDSRYGPRIKQLEQTIQWLTGQPGIKGPLEDFARQMGFDAPDAKRRSTTIGLLKVGFKKSQGGRTLTKVTDLSTAIAYLRDVCPEAIKEDVLVSKIPDDLPLPAKNCGMVRRGFPEPPNIDIQDQSAAVSFLEEKCPEALWLDPFSDGDTCDYVIDTSKIPADLALPGVASGLERVEPTMLFVLE